MLFVTSSERLFRELWWACKKFVQQPLVQLLFSKMMRRAHLENIALAWEKNFSAKNRLPLKIIIVVFQLYQAWNDRDDQTIFVITASHYIFFHRVLFVLWLISFGVIAIFHSALTVLGMLFPGRKVKWMIFSRTVLCLNWNKCS